MPKHLEMSVRLYDRYESLMKVQHYYGVLAIYALCRTAEASGDEALMERCREILRPFLAGEIEHRTNFDMYLVGGGAAAFMLMQGYMPEAKGPVLEKAVQLYEQAPRDRKGIFCLPRFLDQERIWIDVCLAVTPYLLFTGLALQREEYITEAARQTILMYDELLNKENGLLHQCKNFGGPGVISEDHWGRGNGWGYLGLTELVQYLPADFALRQEVEERFVALTKALLRYQTPSGMWRQEIPADDTYEETSGTGLIAYGLGVGLRTGLLKDVPGAREGFWQAVEGLKGYVDANGSVRNVCVGCLYPGDLEAYKAHPYKTDDPHGFAPVMFAFVEAFLLGQTREG